MITVYKIGKHLYEKDGQIVDKNSGYFEYKLIEAECKRVHTNKNVLVIINGLLERDEDERLLQMMQKFDKRIFIASDIISFTNNVQIINRCDYLLHQCPQRAFDNFSHLRQEYSCVPELFFSHCMPYNAAIKDNHLVFGGGVRDNEEKIKEYLSVVPSTALLKTDAADSRLPYENYLCELGRHRYALIVSRTEYSKHGWITARFFEAIRCGCIPIVDSEYDKDNYFLCDKVSSAEEVKELINFYESHPNMRHKEIFYYTHLFRQNRDCFKQLLTRICAED